MKKVLLTIATNAVIGSIAGLLIGLLLTLMLVPFTANTLVLGLAFYMPTIVTPLTFAINAANELQEEQFVTGYLIHHGQK